MVRNSQSSRHHHQWPEVPNRTPDHSRTWLYLVDPGLRQDDRHIAIIDTDLEIEEVDLHIARAAHNDADLEHLIATIILVGFFSVGHSGGSPGKHHTRDASIQRFLEPTEERTLRCR